MLTVSLIAQDKWDPGRPEGSGNQEQGMHACPKGTALAGVRGIGPAVTADNPRNFNDFLCRRVTSSPSLRTDEIQ